MTEPRTTYQCALLLSLLAPLAAHADVRAAVNALRERGCAAQPPRAPALQASRALDEVARRLAAGAPLTQALQRAPYHALRSFSVRIDNVAPDGDVATLLGRQYCAQVTDPALRELGVYRAGSTVWLALAAPFVPPAPAAAPALAAAVLAAVNRARARPQTCGTQRFAPAPALTRSARLESIARAYAQDMAAHGYMSHTGRDGSSPAERVTRGGYRWLATGENLASGITAAEPLVAGWLASPGHCVNLMDPAYTELGVGFAVNARTAPGIYWALELARPGR